MKSTVESLENSALNNLVALVSSFVRIQKDGNAYPLCKILTAMG